MTHLQIAARIALLIAVWPVFSLLLYRYMPDRMADSPGSLGGSFVLTIPLVLLGFALMFWW